MYAVRKKKQYSFCLLILGSIFNLVVLAHYKYGVLGASALLPMGISFFTFKAISYLADIYKGRIALSGIPVRDALYLSFFPQIQSGPLARYSDYSDMAIGLSSMFGHACPENFIYPYTTLSVSKFWRKWHITLGAWFRDYIYIPLGGSRCTEKWRVYVNLLVVWFLTGIWHGASWNFIFWGLGYFVFIAFERMTGMPENLKSKPLKIIYRILVLLFINFQWVIFRADGLHKGLSFIKRMFIRGTNSLACCSA